MGYKLKETKTSEEVEQNLINKFNSFGLEINFDPDDEDEKTEETTEGEEKKEEN